MKIAALADARFLLIDWCGSGNNKNGCRKNTT
jgi:hypothetical protein